MTVGSRSHQGYYNPRKEFRIHCTKDWVGRRT